MFRFIQNCKSSILANSWQLLKSEPQVSKFRLSGTATFKFLLIYNNLSYIGRSLSCRLRSVVTYVTRFLAAMAQKKILFLLLTVLCNSVHSAGKYQNVFFCVHFQCIILFCKSVRLSSALVISILALIMKKY